MSLPLINRLSSTDVQYLIQNSDFTELKRLHDVDSNLILHAKDTKGYSSIHWAAYYDNVEIVMFLLFKCPEIIVSVNDRLQSILHLATSQNSLRVLHTIAGLKYHIPIVNLQNVWGETALHLAAALGNVEIVTLLLRLGADESIRDKWKRSAGDVAMQNGYGDRVFSDGLLSKEHVSIPEVEELPNVQQTSISPLIGDEFFSAVLARRSRASDGQSRHVNIDNTLVKVRHMFGESVETVTGIMLNDNKHDTTKITPVATSTCTALSKLIEYPGDPIKMASLLTSDTVAIHGRDMFGLTALHKVASWDKVDLLDMLLLHASTDSALVNARSGDSDGFTPLHMCVDSGACAAARRLLADPRVDLTSTDKAGRTAMALALQQQKRALVDIFNERR